VKPSKGMSRPLRQREYRLLFSGQVVSNLGDWLDFIALAVLIAYVWEMGPAALAGLSVAIAVPWIFLAPLSGVLVDRWPKKPVLIGSDLLRAVFVTGLIFAPNLGVLIALVVAKTAVATFFQPAEQATIRIIVAEAQLHAANALTQLVQQSTKVIGPALGGLIVGVASPRVAFGVDAASFLLSALILSRMQPIDDPRGQRAEEDEDDEEGGYWAELREGIAYIAGRRTLVLAIVGLGATIFLLFSFDTLAPLAFQELGVSRSLFGLTVAGIGLGGVLGAIAVGRYGGDANPFSLLGGGVSIVGCCVALIGFALVTSLDAPQWIWVPVLVVVGIASAGILVASPTIIQRETPAELMGRVSTSANAIPTGLQMFAPIAGAALAEWQSVGFVFSAAGAGLAGLGLVVLAIRPPVGVGVEPDAPPPPEASSGSHAAAAPASTAGSAKDQDRASSVRSHRNITEVRMSDDLDILKSAGFNLDVLSAQEQEAVSNLSRDELETLAAIRTKLNAEPEVSGHARALAGDGNFVW
jgi:MFS family permease